MRKTKNRDAETKKEENIENEGGTDYGTAYHRKEIPVSESDRRRGRSDDREIRDAVGGHFWKEHKNSLYQSLFLTGKLNSHLEQIEKAAQERMDSQMEKLLEKNPAPDKEADPMAWTAHMNALMATAEESILTELV